MLKLGMVYTNFLPMNGEREVWVYEKPTRLVCRQIDWIFPVDCVLIVEYYPDDFVQVLTKRKTGFLNRHKFNERLLVVVC